MQKKMVVILWGHSYMRKVKKNKLSWECHTRWYKLSYRLTFHLRLSCQMLNWSWDTGYNSRIDMGGTPHIRIGLDTAHYSESGGDSAHNTTYYSESGGDTAQENVFRFLHWDGDTVYSPSLLHLFSNPFKKYLGEMTFASPPPSFKVFKNTLRRMT